MKFKVLFYNHWAGLFRSLRRHSFSLIDIQYMKMYGWSSDRWVYFLAVGALNFYIQFRLYGRKQKPEFANSLIARQLDPPQQEYQVK